MSTKRNSDIGPVKLLGLAIVLSGLLTFPLSAEHRVYRSTRPVGQLVPEMIDALAGGGFRFTVRHVYNEEKDGKHGFSFLLLPRKTYGELTFVAEGGESVVRVFTQDADDAARFHAFFTGTMGMTVVRGR